jgi:hypothetical protein
MSEAPNDAALEARALAAMEPAAEPPADKGEAPAAEPKTADPKTRLESTALTIGWSGKDDWKGDPADWLDAPEFILKAAGEVLPSMRKSLEKANDEIKGLKAAVKSSIAHMSKADERAYTKAKAELQAELNAATDKNDILAITQEMVDLEKEVAERPKPDTTPEAPEWFTKWRDDNPWYGTDEAMSAATDAIGKAVFEEGYTGPAQAKEVDARLRAKFPGFFAKPTNPNRNGPAVVEGGGSAPRRGGKSFSDMPRDAQEMCADLMKLSKAITRENYAAQYFASEGKS